MPLPNPLGSDVTLTDLALTTLNSQSWCLFVRLPKYIIISANRWQRNVSLVSYTPSHAYSQITMRLKANRQVMKVAFKGQPLAFFCPLSVWKSLKDTCEDKIMRTRIFAAVRKATRCLNTAQIAGFVSSLANFRDDCRSVTSEGYQINICRSAAWNTTHSKLLKTSQLQHQLYDCWCCNVGHIPSSVKRYPIFFARDVNRNLTSKCANVSLLNGRRIEILFYFSRKYEHWTLQSNG